MFNVDINELFLVTSDDEIISASREVFFSVVGNVPVHLGEEGYESLDEYANIEVDGINTNDRIVGKLLSQGSQDVLCVIVFDSFRYGIYTMRKLCLDFYIIENKVSAVKNVQVIIFSGDDSCIVGQGSPERMAELKRIFYQQTSGDGAPGETWFGMNKTCLNFCAVSALTLAVAGIFWKKRNWF